MAVRRSGSRQGNSRASFGKASQVGRRPAYICGTERGHGGLYSGARHRIEVGGTRRNAAGTFLQHRNSAGTLEPTRGCRPLLSPRHKRKARIRRSTAQPRTRAEGVRPRAGSANLLAASAGSEAGASGEVFLKTGNTKEREEHSDYCSRVGAFFVFRSSIPELELPGVDCSY